MLFAQKASSGEPQHTEGKMLTATLPHPRLANRQNLGTIAEGEVPMAWTLHKSGSDRRDRRVRSAQQVSGIAGATDIELSPEENIRMIEQDLNSLAASRRLRN